MKDGDQLTAQEAPMLRGFKTVGCTYQTPQGEMPAVLLTLEVGPKSAPIHHGLVVPAHALKQVAEALLVAHEKIAKRLTPGSNAKH